ncbi:hypothetical protein B0T24DRAFT_41087 [Lasiosphaeria ovina]|uniref:Uncharacterized protein n=1 Tax=Lasiosphaeria ovina TaxID=92902 RepID=A0AAE0NKH3_9PEZI|nr:hypothetical protein B0T24DRAFT_41087 [Lasiosphaeria ovina]
MSIQCFQVCLEGQVQVRGILSCYGLTRSRASPSQPRGRPGSIPFFLSFFALLLLRYLPLAEPRPLIVIARVCIIDDEKKNSKATHSPVVFLAARPMEKALDSMPSSSCHGGEGLGAGVKRWSLLPRTHCELGPPSRALQGAFRSLLDRCVLADSI